MEGKAFPKEGSCEAFSVWILALTVEVDKKIHTLVIFLWNAVLL